MEISRRFFLGGAISLIAVSTFKVTAGHGNSPRIWADGQNDDTSGLHALFHNEPVIFSSDDIGVSESRDMVVHRGVYRVSRTIELPPGLVVKVENMTFRGVDLDEALPYLRGRQDELKQFTGLHVHYVDKFAMRRELMQDCLTPGVGPALVLGYNDALWMNVVRDVI
jgi:hypothetical protein